jgi:hypothetical protein
VKPKTGLLFASALVAALASVPQPLAAQAFTLPQGVGAVTLAWQYVDNTGHRLTDGFLRKAGESVTTSVILETEYGVTDRLSATVGVPYVWARYTGGLPPRSNLPVDACRCWHSGLQDFSFSARYRLGTESLAFTPHVRYVLPSHDYAFRGEAVLGRNLQETQVGGSVGARLPGILSKASFQAIYSYAFVEEVADLSIDRSNVFFDLGYAVSRRLYVRASANRQETHGGLRSGSLTGNPFFPPGEFNTPERLSQADRLIKSRYWQAGGGLSYSVGPADVFVAYSAYVWGRDAHDGQVYTVGATWYVDLGK